MIGESRILLILSLLFVLVFASSVQAQTPTPPTPHDALIQAIQERAQRDVELGKAPEGITGLDVLFGKEGAAVGLSMSEVLEIYEEAYTAATPDEPWWTSLQPSAGWIAAAVLFVLFIIFQRRFMEGYMTSGLK